MAYRMKGQRPTRRGGLSPTTAIATIAGVLIAGGLASRRYSPDPSHPRIARWYHELEKPEYKPPDPLFGAIWPLLQMLHSVGAYRLMRMPRSPDRDAALALWFADMALVAGWARIFFGGRELTGGALGAAVLARSMLSARGGSILSRARSHAPLHFGVYSAASWRRTSPCAIPNSTDVIHERPAKEAFAYVVATTPDEFAAIREDITLRIMETIAAAGAQFAFPSVTHYGCRIPAGRERAKEASRLIPSGQPCASRLRCARLKPARPRGWTPRPTARADSPD